MNRCDVTRYVLLILIGGLCGCGATTVEGDGDRSHEGQPAPGAGQGEEPRATPQETQAVQPAEDDAVEDDGDERIRLSAADRNCHDRIPLFVDGEQQGEICPRAVRRHGLTILDLSDDWTPIIFSESLEHGELGEQPYRETYLALADEQFERIRVSRRTEQYLELYGIFPTFRVLRERLSESGRHECHDRVADEALDMLENEIRPLGAQSKSQRRTQRHLRFIKQRLERELEKRELNSFEELREEAHLRQLVDRYEKGRGAIEAVTAMQAHLECDGYLGGRYSEGIFDGPTLYALRLYQRRHMIVSIGFLEEESRRILALDSREADFIATLRALRERIVDAAGLIEDGSARHEWGRVLGRQLDTKLIQFDAGQPALPEGAPDLVSAATEAAARALGWTSPEATLAFLEGLGEGSIENYRVAVMLPPRPEYQSEHMDLRAVIDRGDVYYELGNRGRRVERRPILTLYVRHDGRETALIRWGTTIGGWQPENTEDGGIGLRYKDSPPGERIWRDVVASPAWLPPPSTPDDELIQRSGDGWTPKRGLFGPGYRSAYGLVMMMHHKVLSTNEDGEVTNVRDEGIRTHGSVSYRTIDDGYSHGCHRLYNHLAVRLASFLIRHRSHERRGSITVDFHREVEVEGNDVSFSITSRGYQFELTPPMPVEVLEGNIMRPMESPSRSFRRVRYPEEATTEDENGDAEAGAPDSGASNPSLSPSPSPSPTTPRTPTVGGFK
jgi:hypothetical protein